MAVGAGRAMGAAMALLAALRPLSAEAGAWLQPEGQGQIIFNPTVMSAGGRFDRSGRSERIDRFVKQDNVTLVEYGARPNVTLVLQLGNRGEAYPIEGAVQRVYTSLIGAGARLELWRGERFALSVQATAATGFERATPSLDRRFGVRSEADARLLAGYSFDIGEWPAFVEAQMGYRWRSGRFADEARLDLTFGFRPFDRLQILLQSFNSAALQGQDVPRERPRQHKLQASAVFDVTANWSVQAGVFTSVAGRQSLKEQGVLLGVWRKF
jgi:protein XagA